MICVLHIMPSHRRGWNVLHYYEGIMIAMASKITSLAIVYSTVCSSYDQRKHQSPASLAFVRGIHRWPVNSPHKGPVTRKMFPFNEVIMETLFHIELYDTIQQAIKRPSQVINISLRGSNIYYHNIYIYYNKDIYLYAQHCECHAKKGEEVLIEHPFRHFWMNILPTFKTHYSHILHCKKTQVLGIRWIYVSIKAFEEHHIYMI